MVMPEESSQQQQLGLRRRYVALLVPALARVHAAHPHGHGSLQHLARARAVRQVADTCLLQAMSTRPALHLHRQLRRRACSSRSLQRSSFSCKLLRKAKAKAKRNFWRRASGAIVVAAASPTSRRTRQLINGGLRNNCPLQTANYRWISSRSSANDAEEESWNPDQNDLQRLQMVISCPADRLANVDTDDDADEDVNSTSPGVFNHCSSSTNVTVDNPAALLSQAAHYILALQVQVDTLRSLANLSS
ncbi:hypothetical protein L7F22_001103 [Adiantum nelumboides]|nr:hypothetical protein [Adiantum nelumboides]